MFFLHHVPGYNLAWDNIIFNFLAIFSQIDKYINMRRGNHFFGVSVQEPKAKGCRIRFYLN